MKKVSTLYFTMILCASLVLLKASHVAAQDSQKIYESNYKTPYSKNYRSEDGRGNFNFGYDIEDGLGGGQFRRESGNTAGERRGSYGFRSADGRVRVVHWVADHFGYRAAIVSNEPGVIAHSPADVSYNGAPVRYSSDTQGAPLPSSDNTPPQYQPATFGQQSQPASAVFAAPANADAELNNFVSSSNVTPLYARQTAGLVNILNPQRITKVMIRARPRNKRLYPTVAVTSSASTVL
ncbi:cuticular protein-like [Tropilaelaps mercedesae]|uniref:Cuticular protein-like n=1 Tax=Tropilaelaps mercedesae TaxID=418985 RepID=A0A1V9XUX7_9ACAR|nr:cuticular protein-like [Tropilaelaps mercedesae]